MGQYMKVSFCAQRKSKNARRQMSTFWENCIPKFWQLFFDNDSTKDFCLCSHGSLLTVTLLLHNIKYNQFRNWTPQNTNCTFPGQMNETMLGTVICLHWFWNSKEFDSFVTSLSPSIPSLSISLFLSLSLSLSLCLSSLSLFPSLTLLPPLSLSLSLSLSIINYISIEII